MWKTTLFIPLFACCLAGKLSAQRAFAVTDSTPLVINGLQMGFTILNASEKEVGKKGEFSRYSVRFFATNNTSEAKIFLYRPEAFGGNTSPDVVHFSCSNATGARFTSNAAFLQAQPCNVPVQMEEKGLDGKIFTSKRVAQIGYWIRPGESIHTDVIFIVPLGQYPQVTASPVFTDNMAGAR